MLTQIFRLESPQRDESTGFLICEGIAARTGVQPYSKDEISEEHRHPGVEWYFVYRDAAFISTFNEKTSTATVPVVNEHSPVNALTGDENVVGWISQSEVVDTAAGNAYLKVRVTITCPMSIDRILTDPHVGLSMGYTSKIIAMEQTAPWIDHDGVVGDKGTEYPYNLQATDPTVNHLALCTVGRAGEVTAINQDSMESAYIIPEGATGPSIGTSVVSNAPHESSDQPEEQHDDYKLYRYPLMDEQSEKALKDAIASALSDMLPKAMSDAFASKECKDSLYGAFTAMDLASAIRSMYEKDKPAMNPEDQANQERVKSVAFEKGFQNDSAAFGAAVVDSIRVWREVGTDLADSANEAMSATELKSAWLKSKGVELNDSMTVETINSLYDTVRKLATSESAAATTPASQMKGIFDSFKAPAVQTNQGLNVLHDSFGGAVYL